MSAREIPTESIGVAWHGLSAHDVFARLGVDGGGLSSAEAALRLARYGENILPRPVVPGFPVFFLRQFANPLIYLLLAAAAVSLAARDWLDGAFIFGVLAVNALLGAVQEHRAGLQTAALDRLIEGRARVLRDGVHEEIPARGLLPGDRASLEAGASVPADLRLLSTHELRVDESLLTGESALADKDAEAPSPLDAGLAERRNMLHAGTTILSGQAEAIVVATGRMTEIGRMAATLARPGGVPPLIRRLDAMNRLIALAMVASIAAITGAFLLQGRSVAEIFFVAVALMVSAIPEGLPVAITVALSIATQRMARHNVVVRRLAAVEGLGSCTIVASDKTGTLTRNELTVGALWLAGVGEVAVSGRGYDAAGRVLARDPAARAASRDLAETGAICNDAGVHWHDGICHRIGDTVDVAFLVLAHKTGIDASALRAAAPVAKRIPFAPERRYAAVYLRAAAGPSVHVKGAPEAVLPMCDAADIPTIRAETEKLAARGFRVLALARGPSEPGAPLQGLEFLGLAALSDPVRGDAKEAVARCIQAGIAVCMVTGDHPVTALAVARELGIARDPADVITNVQLTAAGAPPADSATFDALVAHGRVFARVEPVQKLAIVEALQRLGHSVAVTGDGANDAPALHRADIGVAMGKSGTDVARDAADLVLADDNFVSIVAGIEEGRIAYANVRKIVYLLIGTGVAEIVIFLFALFAGLPLPLTALQLLWLNIVTNGIQDIALAFERGEPDILRWPPRPPGEAIFDRMMTRQVAVSGLAMGGLASGLFAWAMAEGWSETAARNAVLLLMVLFENVHVFNCRSERRSVFAMRFFGNPYVPLSVLLALGVHLGAMHVPFFGNVLGLTPVPPLMATVLAGMAAAPLLVMEICKRVLGGYRAGQEESPAARGQRSAP